MNNKTLEHITIKATNVPPNITKNKPKKFYTHLEEIKQLYKPIDQLQDFIRVYRIGSQETLKTGPQEFPLVQETPHPRVTKFVRDRHFHSQYDIFGSSPKEQFKEEQGVQITYGKFPIHLQLCQRAHQIPLKSQFIGNPRQKKAHRTLVRGKVWIKMTFLSYMKKQLRKIIQVIKRTSIYLGEMCNLLKNAEIPRIQPIYVSLQRIVGIYEILKADTR